MPTDYIMYYYVHDMSGNIRYISNGRKGVFEYCNEIGGYVVAEGQSGEKRVVYHAKDAFPAKVEMADERD